MSDAPTPPSEVSAKPQDSGRSAADAAEVASLAGSLAETQEALFLLQDAVQHLLSRPRGGGGLPHRIPSAKSVRKAGYRGSWLKFRRDLRLIARSALFDAAFYMSRNPDLAFGTMAPAAHYLLFGGHEGRNPSPGFDSNFYLQTNADVAASGHNPLLHFLRHGQREGRLARPDTGLVSGGSASGGVLVPAVAKPRTPRFFDRLDFCVRWRGQPLSPPPGQANPDSLDIHWVIPDFHRGAGGHMTIFRIVRFLEAFGHRQTLWIMNPTVHRTADEALDTINRHFQPTHPTVRLLPTGDLSEISGDAIIATDRWTAFPVNAMANFRRRFYFVQDHEGEFYPSGSDSLLAQKTYAFGFDCLCAGEWLHGLMSQRYGLWSMKWDLAYDHTVYHPPEGPHPTEPRVAFYARYATPRRAVELGMLALEELARRGVPFTADLYGGELPRLDLAFPYIDHGVLSSSQLGKLYRQARVGMVFSATNHSLIPREMMACGLPLVELDTENVTSVFPREVVELAAPEPFAIADALERLLTDPVRWQARSEAGLAYVQAFDWQASARLIEAALRQRLAAG